MKKFSWFCLPYVIWLLIIVAIPFLAMVVLSFAEVDGLDFSSISFSTASWQKLLSTENLQAFGYSMKIALISTAICVVIGYACAYFVSTLKIRNRMGLILILVLPMLSNLLLRIIAFEKLFSEVGILNSFGISLNLMDTDFAVIFSTVSIYLPFMILPVYTVLEKMDKSLIEASRDLGCGNIKTFFKVTLPLSIKGVFSGFIMVFLPSATGFAIPERLASTKLTIGKLIEQKFKTDFDYSMGSLLSVIVVIIVLGAILIMNKVDSEGETLL